MFLQLFLFVVGVVATGYAVTVEDCPSNLVRSPRLKAHGSSCYLFVLDHEREFDSAERECEARGGHLVIIRDMETQHFLYTTLRNEFHSTDGVLWIGLSDERNEGHFLWVDGTRTTFTYWASGQPGYFGSLEDCVAMDMAEGGHWHDYRCADLLFIHYQNTFVCEYPIVKTTTTSSPTTATSILPTTPAPPTTTTPDLPTTAPNTPVPTTTTPIPTTTTTTTTTTPVPTTTTPIPTTTTPVPTTTTPVPTTTTTTTTPVPTTTTPMPTTTTTTTTGKPTHGHHTHAPHTTKDHPTGHGGHNNHPPKTTASTSVTTECPPFECSKDCGFSGYQVDDNSCLLCQCAD